jgi:hypothetical protein
MHRPRSRTVVNYHGGYYVDRTGTNPTARFLPDGTTSHAPPVTAGQERWDVVSLNVATHAISVNPGTPGTIGAATFPTPAAATDWILYYANAKNGQAGIQDAYSPTNGYIITMPTVNLGGTGIGALGGLSTADPVVSWGALGDDSAAPDLYAIGLVVSTIRPTITSTRRIFCIATLSGGAFLPDINVDWRPISYVTSTQMRPVWNAKNVNLGSLAIPLGSPAAPVVLTGASGSFFLPNNMIVEVRGMVRAANTSSSLVATGVVTMFVDGAVVGFPVDLGVGIPSNAAGWDQTANVYHILGGNGTDGGSLNAPGLAGGTHNVSLQVQAFGNPLVAYLAEWNIIAWGV